MWKMGVRESTALGLILLVSPEITFAEWEATVGYYDLKSIPAFGDLGAAVLGGGYRISLGQSLTLTPAVRFGYGINDGQTPIRTGTVEGDMPVVSTSYIPSRIDSFYGVQFRTEWDFDSGFYTYLSPSYTAIKVSATGASQIKINSSSDSGFSIGGIQSGLRPTDSDSGFGLGIGVGYQFNQLLSVELAVEKINLYLGDKPQILSLQTRCLFRG